MINVSVVFSALAFFIIFNFTNKNPLVIWPRKRDVKQFQFTYKLLASRIKVLTAYVIPCNSDIIHKRLTHDCKRFIDLLKKNKGVCDNEKNI